MRQGLSKPLGALSGKIGSNKTSWLEIIDTGFVSSSVTHANWGSRHPLTQVETKSKEVEQASLPLVTEGGPWIQKEIPREIPL